MFNESIDLLWLAIALAVLVVSGFFSYLLYHMAHLVRESKRTVEDVNSKLKRVDPAVDATVEAIEDISDAIGSIRTNVVEPVAGIASAFKGLTSILNRFRK